MDEQNEILLKRSHPIIQRRKEQLLFNRLVLDGGRPYINARLTRFPYEPEASWTGNAQTNAPGRKERAKLINYAGRIATKFSQYVFGQPIERAGSDNVFTADVTMMRNSVTDFMRKVDRYLTGSGHCWVSADRSTTSVDAQTGTVRPQTIAQREASRDRVFWRLWHALEVPDWKLDAQGRLQWLITEEQIYDAGEPTSEGKMQRIRTVWKPGGGTRYFIDPEHPEKYTRAENFSLSVREVPFVPVGEPSFSPWWFDDVEGVQACLLNLESAHNENLYQAVYPQMVLPASMKNDVSGGKSAQQGELSKLVGLHYPIFEASEESGLTRYVCPPADALKLLPEEIQRAKKEMFETVGMAMNNPESKQVQSADSKRWDNLDPTAVLAERSTILQETESRLIALSKGLDTGFKEYQPAYSKKFNITDAREAFQALLELQNIDLPSLARSEVRRAGVKLLHDISPIPPDRMKAIEDQIEAEEGDEPLPVREPPPDDGAS